MEKINKVGIISGRFPASKFHSNVNHLLYAEAHGYTYIHCNYPTRAKNPYMNKIYYLINYFHLFDYLIWIDDDAFFFDFKQNIFDYAPQGNNFVSFCSSPDFKELKTVISSGQFLIKCNDIARKFLESVLTADLSEIKKWWKPQHGFFTNGDQDAMVYLLESDPNFRNKVAIFNYKCFNSRAENVLGGIDEHNPLILHFTGKPEIKWQNYKLVQEKFKVGMSLTKPEQVSVYGKYSDEENIKENYKSLIKRRIKDFIKLK